MLGAKALNEEWTEGGGDESQAKGRLVKHHLRFERDLEPNLEPALVTVDAVILGVAWGSCMQRLGLASNMPPRVSEGHRQAILSLGGIELSPLVILAS